MGRPQPSLGTGNKVVSFLIFILFAMLSGPAYAFIDPPVLAPSNPAAGETISVRIHSGYCDAFVTPPPPQITQVGNAIHLLLTTLHFNDPLWCLSPPSVTETFPVGSFPPGVYTLHVERFYDSAVPERVYETLANFEFTVQSTVPAAIPATGTIGSLLLILCVIVVVTWKRTAGHVSLLFLVVLMASPSVVLAPKRTA